MGTRGSKSHGLDRAIFSLIFFLLIAGPILTGQSFSQWLQPLNSFAIKIGVETFTSARTRSLIGVIGRSAAIAATGVLLSLPIGDLA